MLSINLIILLSYGWQVQPVQGMWGLKLEPQLLVYILSHNINEQVGEQIK